jgi:hypothetical protein
LPNPLFRRREKDVICKEEKEELPAIEVTVRAEKKQRKHR